MIRPAILLASLTLISTSVQADEREPTDVELRAAYCEGVIMGDIDGATKAIADIKAAGSQVAPGTDVWLKGLTLGLPVFRERLSRLNAYLLPRAFDLDIVAITMATAHGRKVSAIVWPGGPPQIDKLDASEQTSYSTCAKLNWLPF
jgi:hypothetical protein